jgi:hypothetical protein
MSLFTLATTIQLTTAGTVPFTITDTADAIVTPAANQVCLYHYLPDADDFRKGEIYRGWDSLYRGWKSHAYDPFEGVGPNDVLLAMPLNSPYIASRKITTDFDIDVIIVSGDIGFGIDANLDIIGKNILQVRSAFGSLRDYYLEKVK